MPIFKNKVTDVETAEINLIEHFKALVMTLIRISVLDILWPQCQLNYVY